MKFMLTNLAYALGIFALLIALYGVAMPALGLKTGSERVTIKPPRPTFMNR